MVSLTEMATSYELLSDEEIGELDTRKLRRSLRLRKKTSKSGFIERGPCCARACTRAPEWKRKRLSLFKRCDVIEL